MFFSKLALGVDWSAEGLKLVALGRRFRKLRVLDWAHVPGLLVPPNVGPGLAPAKAGPAGAGVGPTGEAKNRVQEFLRRNHVKEARVIACLPRESFFVRFLDLPSEAESQLARVIGYQIDTLHPFQGTSIRWDCAVVARDTKAKQVRVMIAIAEQSVLDRQYQALKDLGLRVDSLTLAAAPLANLLKTSLPETALVVLGRGKRVELLGFRRGNLVAAREVVCDSVAPISDRRPAQDFGRELHALWSVLPAEAATTIATFTWGQIPEAFAEFLGESKRLPPPKLPLRAPEKFDWENMLPALAAAYAGLRRKLSPAINLLPLEYRARSSRWSPVPLYALGASASLMGIMLLAHGPIETAMCGRALNREIGRLNSQAEAARRQSQQVAHLSERAALLGSLRAETWQKLRIMREITNLLPDGTWVQDLQVNPETVEFSGFSNRAAELIQPLENSPYFSQVEFTSPITRDAQNREAFHIRMRVGKPARP